jgi:hypothetical protein
MRYRPQHRTFDSLRLRLMSAADWVVLGDGSEVEQRLERQAEGATRQRYSPGETSIRDGRISEFPRLVNTSEKTTPPKFSKRMFVLVMPSSGLCRVKLANGCGALVP